MRVRGFTNDWPTLVINRTRKPVAIRCYAGIGKRRRLMLVGTVSAHSSWFYRPPPPGEDVVYIRRGKPAFVTYNVDLVEILPYGCRKEYV